MKDRSVPTGLDISKYQLNQRFHEMWYNYTALQDTKLILKSHVGAGV